MEVGVDRVLVVGDAQVVEVAFKRDDFLFRRDARGEIARKRGEPGVQGMAAVD